MAAIGVAWVMTSSVFAANVAKIGDTEYATIDAAIDAWKEGDEIKLLCNIDRADYFFITKNFVIDGCWYTLKCTKAHDGYNYFVNNNGYKQTFKNITIDGNKQVAYAAQCINTSSTLILDNVTLKGGKTKWSLSDGAVGYGLHINKGNVFANNLKIYDCDGTAVYIDSNKAAGGSFTLTGDNCDLEAVGIASGSNPVLSITAKGFCFYDVKATYTYTLPIIGTRTASKTLSNVISPMSWNQAITIIEDKIGGYTIKSATVTLKDEVNFKEPFTSNESRLTVDGAGKTVTGKFIFNSSTPTTIKNIVLGNGSVLDCTASTKTGFSGVSVAANTAIDILLPASTDMNSYALPVSLATDAVANIFVGDKKYIAKNGVISSAEKLAQIGDKQYATLQEAIDAANGAVIQVLKDVALTSSLTIPAGKTLTLNLAGRKVTVSGADYALVNNGNLTIVDMGLVTVVAAEATIGDETAAPILIMAPSANDGVAVIDDATGGSIAGVQNNGTFALESGSVVASSANVPAIDNTANAVATITGGTVEGKLQSTDKSALAITGGSFTGESNVSDFVGGDYGVDSNGAIVKNVAKIGEVGYLTLDDAIAAAQPGDTITLFSDVTATEVIALNKSLIINGNGHNVTSSAKRVFRVTTADTDVTLNDVNMISTAVRVGDNDIRGISIDILDKVELTLNNCSVDFTDPSANDWAYAVNVTGGNNHILTVNGGTYEGANVINVRGANHTVTVQNATLNSMYPNHDELYGACIWVQENQGSSVEATGNTFNGSNAVAFNLGNGTVLTESNNVDNTTRCVAKIGAQYYNTLQTAIDAAQEGDTVTLLSDVELNETLSVAAGKSVTLDLAGFAIESSTTVFEVAGALTLYGGTLIITDSAKDMFAVTGEGSITLKHGLFSSDVTEYCADGLVAVKQPDGLYALCPDAKVEVLDPIVLKAGEYGVFTGNWPPADATEDSYLSVVMKFTAKDTKETIKTSPFKDYATDFYITISGMSGDSFIADENTFIAGSYGDYGWIKIPLQGMEIKNGERYPVLGSAFEGSFSYEFICTSVKEMLCAMTISPEIVAANPNLKVVLDLAIAEDPESGDGALNVGGYDYSAEAFMPAVAQIGEVCYRALADAFEDAQEGDTVELLSDASVEGTAQIPAGVTIKSNGYKILGSIRMLGDLTLDGALEITGGLWVGRSGETLSATLAGDKLTASYFMFQYGSYTIDADIDAVYGYLSFEGEFEVNSTITTSNTNGEPLYLNGKINLNEGASFVVKYLYLSYADAILTVKKGASIVADNGVTLTAAGAKLYSAGDILAPISAPDGTTVSLTGGKYVQNVAAWCAEGYNSVKQPGKDLWQVGKLPNAEVINVGPYTVDDESYYIYNITNKTFTSGHKDEFDLQVTLGFIANDTVEEAAANAYGQYLTDFRIKIEGIEGDSFVADKDCYLAGYYPFFGGWVKVNLDGMTIENNVGYPVITGVTEMPFTYETICEVVQSFICGIHLSDEVLKANPNLKVSLELGLAETQDKMLDGTGFITVGDTYDYTAGELQEAVALTGADYFTTIDAAVAAALETGNFVKLVKDASLQGNLDLGGNLVLNLGGKELKANGKMLAITDAVVTITNGTLSGFSAANITLAGNAILTVTGKDVADSFRTEANYYVSQNANGTHSIMLKSAFRVFITMVDGEPRIGFFKDCDTERAPTAYAIKGATNLETPEWADVDYETATDAAPASELPLHWVRPVGSSAQSGIRFFKLSAE